VLPQSFSNRKWSGSVTLTLADSNVWLALTLTGHDFHESALRWLETVKRPGEILFCRATQQSFLRLLTTSAVLSPFGNSPLSNAEAWELYQGILKNPRIAFAQEPVDVERHWQRLALRTTASPKIWMDAYLAAFAIAGQYRLVTIDAAFDQFNELDLLLLHR